MASTGSIYNTTGTLTITGVGGAGTSNTGVVINTGSNIIGNGSTTGDVTLIADTLSLANVTGTTTGTFWYKPYTDSTTVGIAGASGTLQVTSAIIAATTAGTISIGRSDGTGLMRVAGYDASARNWNLSLLTGSGNIQFDGVVSGSPSAWTMAASKNFSATTTSGSILSNAAGSIVTSGTGTITLDAGNDLNFAHDFDLTTASGAVLLKARNSILYSASGDITTSNAAVTLNSDSDASGAGAISLGTGTAIGTSGGNITLGGGADPTATAAYGTASNVIGISLSSASITTTSGNILMRGHGYNTAAADNYGVYLNASTVQSTAGGTLTAVGVGGSGTNTNYGITLSNTGIFQTADGALSVTGTGGGSGATNAGVVVGGSSIIRTTGTGNLTVTGTGGNGTTNNYGVYTTSTSAGIKATGSGNVTVTGTGGAGTSGNIGITISVQSAGNGIIVNTGSLNVTGTGGSNGTNNDNRGIDVSSSATVGSTGTGAGLGAVTITATGANGFADNYGVYTTGAISTVDANLTVNATGGNGSNARNYGFRLEGASAAIKSTGSGNVTVTATGGGGTGTNYGAYIYNGASIYTTTGTLSLTGIGGAGANNFGIITGAGTNVIGGASTTGNITLTADTASFTANTSIRTAGTVTITTYTDSTTIGINGAAGTLGLTSTYLSYINAGSTVIGRTDGTGLMRVAGADLSSYTLGNLSLLNGGGNIQFDGGGTALTLATNKSFSTAATSGSFTTSATSGIVTSGTGDITIDDPMTLGGNLTLTSADTVTFGSTVNGGYNLTGSAGTFSFASAWGGSTPLSAVSLTSTNAMTLPSITAASILARTTGASSDLTLAGGSTLTASGSGTAITLASERNFINSAGSGALVTPSGRWLVYSADPASDTIGSLANDFRRFSCAYGGSCPSFPGTGNGLLYSSTPTLTATPNGISLTYGDAAPSLAGYAYTLTGYLGSDSGGDSVTGSLTGGTTYAQGSNAGSYHINYGSGTLASTLGYGFSYANNATAITVCKKALTAAVQDQSITYGTNTLTLSKSNTSHVTYSGLYGSDSGADLDTVTFSYGGATAGSVNNAGSYTLGISAFTDNNYSLSLPGGVTTGTLTIGKAHLTVTADDKSKTYGDANPVLTATLTGFVNGEVLGTSGVTGSASLSTAATGSSNAGTYSITAAQGMLAASNYDFTTFNSGTLTIGKKALTAVVQDQSLTYGDTTPTLSKSNNSHIAYTGFYGSDSGADLDTVTFSYGGAAAGSVNNAGSYTFSLSAFTDNNYSLALPGGVTNGTLTIGKKGLTVTADDFSRASGVANPIFTASYSGFVLGELFGTSGITGSPDLTTLASSSSPAGTYAIDAAPGSLLSGNYDFTFVDGVLTVAAPAYSASNAGGNQVTDAMRPVMRYLVPRPNASRLNLVIRQPAINLRALPSHLGPGGSRPALRIWDDASRGE